MDNHGNVLTTTSTVHDQQYAGGNSGGLTKRSRYEENVGPPKAWNLVLTLPQAVPQWPPPPEPTPEPSTLSPPGVTVDTGTA